MTGQAAAKKKISSVKLKYTSMEYTGKVRTQTVTVKAKVSGKLKTLKKGTDYTVSYKNNTKVGTATLIVKGKGKYTGTIKKTFKITPVKLASVKLKYSKMEYTGKALTQTVTVKAKVNKKTVTLKKGTDYTVSYKNNINVGTATVTVKGKGNFTGTIKKTFTIYQKEPEPGEVIDPVNGWGVYDELIAQIRTEVDRAKRASLLRKAEDMLMSTYAILPVYYYNDRYLLKSSVTGVYMDVFGNKHFRHAGGNTDVLRLRFGFGPGTMDPAYCNSADDMNYAVNAFSGLYMYSAKDTISPACADHYTVSADGLFYTVTLKEGLKWSDGSALTGSDFEYS